MKSSHQKESRHKKIKRATKRKRKREGELLGKRDRM